MDAARRILKQLGVELHPQKTRIVHVRDGFEFLRDIRALGTEEGSNVPVIAMTVGGQAKDRDRLVAAYFQAHLDKPFGSDELLEAVKSVLISQAPLA